MSLPFETFYKSENRKVEFILDFPVFNQGESEEQKKAKKKKKSHWNAFNLVPDTETYGAVTGTKYSHKILCEFAANGDYALFHRLYNDTPVSEVWEYLALRKAVNYES